MGRQFHPQAQRVAANTRGHKLVGAEAFTGMAEQSRWLEHPYALKSVGDTAFSFGVNRLLFHRYAMQPHPDAVPGMTMGPWGIHYDRTCTWFEQSAPWIEYLARSQFMLQQGNHVADVLYFTGEGAPQRSRRTVPELPYGYTFDAIDTARRHRPSTATCPGRAGGRPGAGGRRGFPGLGHCRRPGPGR